MLLLRKFRSVRLGSSGFLERKLKDEIDFKEWPIQFVIPSSLWDIKIWRFLYREALRLLNTGEIWHNNFVESPSDHAESRKVAFWSIPVVLSELNQRRPIHKTKPSNSTPIGIPIAKARPCWPDWSMVENAVVCSVVGVDVSSIGTVVTKERNTPGALGGLPNTGGMLEI